MEPAAGPDIVHTLTRTQQLLPGLRAKQGRAPSAGLPWRPWPGDPPQGRLPTAPTSLVPTSSRLPPAAHRRGAILWRHPDQPLGRNAAPQHRQGQEGLLQPSRERATDCHSIASAMWDVQQAAAEVAGLPSSAVLVATPQGQHGRHSSRAARVLRQAIVRMTCSIPH